MVAKPRGRPSRGAPRGAPSKATPRAERFELFAICAPGLEPVLEAEMRALELDVGKRDSGEAGDEEETEKLFHGCA